MKDQTKERAIIVGVTHFKQKRELLDEYLDELTLLLDTAGAEVVNKIVQSRKSFDPAYFVGTGMANKLAEMVVEFGADFIVFDDDLTPAQVKNLENKCDTKIMDRSGIILDIFARRAQSRESKTQVELAQLNYYLPRLTKLWTHLSRQTGGAGIGLRGPGETQLEVDRRLIRKRITILSGELEKISRQRKIRRKGRKDIYKVALLGYTNAGKSSLLNAMTTSDIFVEDRLFATLDPTVRLLDDTGKDKILLIDTVGFIRKLPHHLVASFKSTLEETQDADLLLHVVDCTHPFFTDQMQVVNSVMKDLKISDRPIITVLNKIDLVEDKSTLKKIKQEFDPCFLISAKRNMFVSDLKQEIIKKVRQQKVTTNIKMKITEQKQLASIYRWAEVLNKEFEDGFVRLKIQFPGNRRGMYYKLIEDGVAVEES